MKATIQALIVIVIVFLIQTITSLIYGDLSIFTLAYPLANDPFSILLSVYSHASIGHLVSNAFALVVFGLLVEYITTKKRFHMFFIFTGIVAGIAEVLFWIIFSGTTIQVLGASGAIFGLMGYVLTGNDLSENLFDYFEISRTKIIAIFIITSIVITLISGGQGVALVAHATGLIIGLTSGYFKILHK